MISPEARTFLAVMSILAVVDVLARGPSWVNTSLAIVSLISAWAQWLANDLRLWREQQAVHPAVSDNDVLVPPRSEFLQLRGQSVVCYNHLMTNNELGAYDDPVVQEHGWRMMDELDTYQPLVRPAPLFPFDDDLESSW